MGEVVEVGGGWSGAERPPPTSTNLHQPPATLLKSLPFPRLASPHDRRRPRGADHARERCRCAGARHSPGRSAPGSLWDTPPGRPLDLPLGGTGEGGGRSGGPAENGRVEVGGVVRRRAGAASVPGAGAAGAAGRAGARAVPLLAHERGGRVIRKREPRWQSAAERALRVDPIHGEALRGLGVVLSRRGLWSEAVPHLRRATEVDPGRAAAWFYLGEALNHVDDLEGARAAYERAVELEPRNTRALYGLGIVLDRLNRPDDATRMYRRSREAGGG